MDHDGSKAPRPSRARAVFAEAHLLLCGCGNGLPSQPLKEKGKDAGERRDESRRDAELSIAYAADQSLQDRREAVRSYEDDPHSDHFQPISLPELPRWGVRCRQPAENRQEVHRDGGMDGCSLASILACRRNSAIFRSMLLSGVGSGVSIIS